MDAHKTDYQKKIEDGVIQFMEGLGISKELPEIAKQTNFFSEMVKGLMKVISISPGRVSCSFTVQPCVANFYKGLHGGAVAIIAERVATGAARTLVAEDKPLFLGETSFSYLSAAGMGTELIVDGSVIRSGRNLSVVSVEFRHKETKKLVYTAQVTFFHLAFSKL